MGYIKGNLQNIPNVNDLQKQIDELKADKQDKLVSGVNIRTVNGQSIVGSGNIHGRPLTIQTEYTTGNIVYDGNDPVNALIPSMHIADNISVSDFDSQLLFYRTRSPFDNEKLLTPYFIGVNDPVTSGIINSAGVKSGSQVTSDNVRQIFDNNFDTIFNIDGITISGSGVNYFKDENDNHEYIQLGNGDDKVGYLKLRLNQGQKALYFKVKLVNETKPGVIFVTDDLSKLDRFTPESTPAGGMPANNPQYIVPANSDNLITPSFDNEWRVVKVILDKNIQDIYITNGRGHGSGKSTTYRPELDLEGNVIWNYNEEYKKWEVFPDRNFPLYGGRVLIKEIGLYYDDEIAPKVLFTADQFKNYEAATTFQLDNIRAIDKRQDTDISNIDAHLTDVEETFTRKFNNLGDIQAYTVNILPETLNEDNLSKIYKQDGLYYDVIKETESGDELIFTFNADFKETVSSSELLNETLENIYAVYQEGEVALSTYLEGDSSITVANNLTGSARDYDGYLGKTYLRLGADSTKGQLVLDYKENEIANSILRLTLKVLPWVKTGKYFRPDEETGEFPTVINGLAKSVVNIYRNSIDNLITSAIIDAGSITDPFEYTYSSSGFIELISDHAIDYTFDVNLMPGDKLIIESTNKLPESSERVEDLDCRLFILGLTPEFGTATYTYREPFVTTDSVQSVSAKKTFEAPITFTDGVFGDGTLIIQNKDTRQMNKSSVILTGSSINIQSTEINLSTKDNGDINLFDAEYEGEGKAYYKGNEITTEDKVVHIEGDETIYGDKTFNDITVHLDNTIFEEDIFIRKGIVDSSNNRIELKDISRATNIENGEGNGALVQTNVAISGVDWSSSNEEVATVDENGLVTAVGYGEATITASYMGTEDTCNVIVSGRPMLRALRPSGLTGYDLLESLDDVDENTDLYIVAYDPDAEDGEKYIGVTGWNGTSDATIGTNSAEWAIYHKEDTALKEIWHKPVEGETSNDNIYIKGASSSNEFKYVASANNTFSITETDSYLLNTNGSQVKYLSINGSYVRFYKANGRYIKFKVFTKHIDHVTDVDISGPTEPVELGETIQLAATIYPADATDQYVNWSSSNNSIVEVEDTHGLTNNVITRSVGNATITVKTRDGGFTASTDVQVKHTIHVESISLDKEAIQIDEGETETITATILPPEATDKTIIWTSSDEQVATVSNGIVSAIAPGNAIITATTVDGGKTATCAVKVVSSNKIVLNTHLLKLKVGETAGLTAKYVSKNVASGSLAVALGRNNLVQGNTSFVQGNNLINTENNQVIFGSYNAESTAKLIIAAGSQSNRFNAFEVFASGKVQSGASTEANDPAKTLTTKDYVDAKSGSAGYIVVGDTTLTEAQLIKLIDLLDALEVKGE